MDGYLNETIIGKVIGASMPPLGADRVMKAMPKNMAAATSGAPPTLEHVALGHWRLTLSPVDVMPDFTAGTVQYVLERTRQQPTITVERTVPAVLEVRWTPK